ncbi:MAG: hypothetical protein ACI4JY_06555 [Oscillospiraceae bacterium]
MDCSLWLNRKKINTAAQIPDNLDVASLRGYFLAGSLVEWLYEHGGEEYAEKLSALDRNDKCLNEEIARIFNGTPLASKPLNGACDNNIADERVPLGAESSFRMPNSFRFTNLSSFSSYEFGSRGVTSFSEFASFLAYLRGLKGGSFSVTSFFSTSFSEHEWEWLWEFLRGYSSGSFVSTSFSASSFLPSSFLSLWGNGKVKLADLQGEWGSFDKWKSLGIDEYDFIMFKTLMICPLDRFGYGIHII